MNMPALLDCRDTESFCQGHIIGASCLPAAQLAARMHELPKRSEPLILCGDPLSLDLAEVFLKSKGYTIERQIIWSEALRADLHTKQQLATGMDSARLWKPAPLIEKFVEELMPMHDITSGVGLDIACGAGRDAVYLAMNGWQMTGIDYLTGAIEKTKQLAQQHQVPIQAVLMDLETGNDPFAAYADNTFDLVFVIRYLHRPLFPYLKRIVKSGGVFMHQTFMQGSEVFGSPKNPNFLLKPNELALLFQDWAVLYDEIEYLEDGRPVSAFVARRPC